MKLNSSESKLYLPEGTGKVWKVIKPMIAWLLVATFSQTPAKADALDDALRNNKSTSIDYKKPSNKLKGNSSYEDHFILYWVWEKTDGGTYNWVGLKYHDENFEWVLEWGKDYTKAWLIWKYDFSNWAYLKWWASYLHYENYKVWDYTVDPTQLNYGFWLWYWNNSYNIETGAIWHKLTWVWNANTTSFTGYVEWAARKRWNYGQIDITASYVYDEAYDVSNDSFNADIAYYPVDDLKVHAGWSSESNSRENYKAMLWFKYTFWWNKKWKLTPYASFNYSKNHLNTGITYEQNIAHRPLSWKDLYEQKMFSPRIHAEQVAPKEFKKRVKETFNKPPVINSIQWPLSVVAWTTVTYKVLASDKDDKNLKYTWKLDWKVIWNSSSVNITFNEVKPYNLEVIVSDWVANTSKTIKINSINNAPNISIISWPDSIKVWETATFTANVDDPDNQNLTYAWYVNWNKLSTSNKLVHKFTSAWNYNIKLVVSDGITTTEKTKVLSVTEEVNQAPTISISANKTTITEWESVTLTANASDSDGNVELITWYDKNWNQVWTWTSITVSPSSTTTYYAVAKDDDGAVKNSNEVTINVEAVAEVSDVVLTPWDNVWNINGDAIEDLGNYNYKVYVDSLTKEWKLTITIKWNEWDDIIEASWYWNENKTYHSNKYDIDIYIDFEYGGN